MAAKAHLVMQGKQKGRGRGHGQETLKDPLSPARLYLLTFPGLPQTAGAALPIMSLFISKLKGALS